MKHTCSSVPTKKLYVLLCNDISLMTLGVVATKFIPPNKQKERKREEIVLLHLDKCMHMNMFMFGT